MVLGAIIFALAYGIYWKVFAPQPPPPPPAAPKAVEHPVPEALIRASQTKVIEISNVTYDALKPKIDALRDLQFAPGTITHVAIKYTAGGQARYLALTELFQTLQIDAPPVLSDYKDFTLYSYSPGIEEEMLCKGEGILRGSCYGPRLGFVIKLQEPQDGLLTKDSARNIMQEWEKTISEDMVPIILDVTEYRARKEFSFGLYKNSQTRFINLPLPSTSVDWLIVDNYLIIATSKNSARAAVDALK